MALYRKFQHVRSCQVFANRVTYMFCLSLLFFLSGTDILEMLLCLSPACIYKDDFPRCTHAKSKKFDQYLFVAWFSVINQDTL